MASITDLLDGRRHPVRVGLSLLFLSLLVILLLLSNTNSTNLFTSYNSSFSKEINASRSSNHPPSSIQSSKRIPNPRESTDEVSQEVGSDEEGGGGQEEIEPFEYQWEMCRGGKGYDAVDYIPCLDNAKAIKGLKSRRHMEHRERHCPKPGPRCLIPLPAGYKTPVPWPRSRDMIWFDNVPHSKLIKYKKDQNWVRRSGDYLVFPGGGTQFKEGVTSYIQFIEKTLPTIGWGKKTRIVLDVGCGVASFGGYLLDRNVLTMSVAPKDEHEAQIQFALERGVPAFLSVIGTQRLTFPDNVFDVIHCARCRVHWDADGGMPLLELNRILRPGGFFIWSATPVYRAGARDQSIWNAMVALTDAICWKTVVRSTDAAGIGLVVYQKPISNACYEERKVNSPPLCVQLDRHIISWYTPLDSCLPKLPVAWTDQEHNRPISWPDRLKSIPPIVPEESSSIYTKEQFNDDTEHWIKLVSNTYMLDLAINWSSIRNVMDMNAGFGGYYNKGPYHVELHVWTCRSYIGYANQIFSTFAAALVDQPVWVMNTVPIHWPDTLRIILDRGLIGVYHDWCEAFNTYPRTYDLLHSSFFFGNLTHRCDILDVVVEMDRILRPGGWVLVQDSRDILKKLRPIFNSLKWETTLHGQQFLVGKKGFWRPSN